MPPFRDTLLTEKSPFQNQIWSIPAPVFNQKSGQPEVLPAKALLLSTKALLQQPKVMLFQQKSAPYSQIIAPITQREIYSISQPSDHQSFTKFATFPNLKPTSHSPPNSSLSGVLKNSLCQEKSFFTIHLLGGIINQKWKMKTNR